MKLTKNELATILTALDADVYFSQKVIEDKLSPTSVAIAKRRVVEVDAIRAKIKNELQLKLKTIFDNGKD